VVRIRRRTVILTTVIAAGAALVLSLAIPPDYEATATVNFGPQFAALDGEQPVPGQTGTPAALAGQQLVTSDPVLIPASRALGGDPSVEELRSDVSASLQTTAGYVLITATAGSGSAAAQIANAVAGQTKIVARNQTRSDLAQLAEAQHSSQLREQARTVDPVQVVQTASAPSAPSSPKPLRNTLIAAFLGLLLGLAVAFILGGYHGSYSRPETESSSTASG
jgi:uncharacterized protein involved in exopolysaccharide biosynthesis